MSKMNLQDSFKKFCEQNGFEENLQQKEIINLLDKFCNNKESFLSRIFKKKKLCFYLHGKVGVGKTMLLNFVYNSLTIKKYRVHFNEFMISFHDFRHKKKDNNTISSFVKKLKRKYDLIYLDEFQVTNIVDAMILGKLFEEIFNQNVKVIVSSNTKISELYKDGLQRDQFKPFIKIMQEKSIEHELVIEDDYRKTKENQKQRYFYPLNQEINFKINKFSRTITKNKKLSSKILSIKGRDFEIKKFYEGVSRFDFKELCDQNLGAEDYLKIAEQSIFMIIEKIPAFNDINSNQQQRFITLIDVIYDKNIPIAATAEQSLEELTSSRSLEKPFKRTISRLFELTSKNFNYETRIL